jgi:hypothetical protein
VEIGTELLLVVIILPGLFAISLLVEAMNKFNRRQGGWVEFILGTTFLMIIGMAYVLLF